MSDAHGGTPHESPDRSYGWVLLLLVSIIALVIGLFLVSEGWSALPAIFIIGGVIGGFFAVIIYFGGRPPKDDASNPASPYNQ